MSVGWWFRLCSSSGFCRACSWDCSLAGSWPKQSEENFFHAHHQMCCGTFWCPYALAPLGLAQCAVLAQSGVCPSLSYYPTVAFTLGMTPPSSHLVLFSVVISFPKNVLQCLVPLLTNRHIFFMERSPVTCAASLFFLTSDLSQPRWRQVCCLPITTSAVVIHFWILPPHLIAALGHGGRSHPLKSLPCLDAEKPLSLPHAHFAGHDSLFCLTRSSSS